MTQARDPNDRDRELDRELISLNRRLTRLEDSQVTGRELKESFGRVYDEIDALEAQIDRRFDSIEGRFDRLESEVRELNGKIETILRYITGLQS
jgi:predicted  nucleic acid-binding Zn-ribbon protein